MWISGILFFNSITNFELSETKKKQKKARSHRVYFDKNILLFLSLFLIYKVGIFKSLYKRISKRLVNC